MVVNGVICCFNLTNLMVNGATCCFNLTSFVVNGAICLIQLSWYNELFVFLTLQPWW
jgi:hypothetical protein